MVVPLAHAGPGDRLPGNPAAENSSLCAAGRANPVAGACQFHPDSARDGDAVCPCDADGVDANRCGDHHAYRRRTDHAHGHPQRNAHAPGARLGAGAGQCAQRTGHHVSIVRNGGGRPDLRRARTVGRWRLDAGLLPGQTTRAGLDAGFPAQRRRRASAPAGGRGVGAWREAGHAHPHAHANANSHPDCDADCDANCDANCDADCDADSHAHGNANCDADSHADRDADCDADSHTHGYADSHADNCAHRDAHPDRDAN